MEVRTDDTPLTEDESIDQDNLTAKVCENARKRLAEQPANPPERYRGKIMLGFNDIPAYLNEQSAEGYSLNCITDQDGYIYVLVESVFAAFTPHANRGNNVLLTNRDAMTADEQKFMADAERPPHWE